MVGSAGRTGSAGLVPKSGHLVFGSCLGDPGPGWLRSVAGGLARFANLGLSDWVSDLFGAGPGLDGGRGHRSVEGFDLRPRDQWSICGRLSNRPEWRGHSDRPLSAFGTG